MRILNYSLLIIVISLDALLTQAQTESPGVINTSSSFKTILNITYEWSVGDLVLAEGNSNKQYSLTIGPLQPQKVVLPDILYGFNIIPNNILTINGDGNNDLWIIEHLEQYPENEVTVFDRAGRIVFFAKNYQNNWNGNTSNHALVNDAYFYVIKLKNSSGNRGTKTGFLTIIK